MARKSKAGPQAGRNRGASGDVYAGRGGQLAVMAELLLKRCNVAIPEVDTGEDVFAFRTDREELARLQVKTATSAKHYKQGDGYSAQFSLPMKQLERADRPPLYYVLAVRLGRHWGDFLIVSRASLSDYWNGARRFGTENPASGDLVLTIQYRSTSVRCSEVDLTAYRNAWELLPPMQPLPDL